MTNLHLTTRAEDKVRIPRRIFNFVKIKFTEIKWIFAGESAIILSIKDNYHIVQKEKIQ